MKKLKSFLEILKPSAEVSFDKSIEIWKCVRKELYGIEHIRCAQVCIPKERLIIHGEMVGQYLCQCILFCYGDDSIENCLIIETRKGESCSLDDSEDAGGECVHSSMIGFYFMYTIHIFMKTQLFLL